MSDPKKQVSFPVWDLETNEIEEFHMDEDDYNDMVEMEKQQEKEREERHKRHAQEDHGAYIYSRDD